MAVCSSHCSRRPAPALVLLLLATAVPICRADIEADRKECQDQLLQLQPCLPYVSKQGPKPTPDCCATLKEVLGKGLRCLCILIKDKDDPTVRNFHIDLDRALGLPNVCALNATTGECPKLLNLAPDSPEAKLFKAVDGKVRGNSTGGSNPGSATAGSAPSSGSGSGSGSGTGTSGAVRRHWLAEGGLWAYTSVAAAMVLVVVFQNAYGA